MANLKYYDTATSEWKTLVVGAKGEQGDVGPANTLEVGTVTDSAPGSTPEVTITGTAPDQTINFVLPTGDTGPQGDPGATGEAGPAGDTGPAGPGVASGGTVGQILTKDSSDDYDTSWQDLPESSGVVSSATAPENTNSIWFNTENGNTYIYYDDFWTSIAGNSGAPIISDTAPTSPVLGTQWFNSSTGKSYLYYSNAWIEIDSNGTATASTGNVIINGAFDIWQRGTSFSAATAYTADRWTGDWNGTGTRVISRQAFSPGTAPLTGYENEFFFRHAQTTAGTGATYNNPLQQNIENVRTLAGQTVTLSFFAKADSNRTVSTVFGQFFGSGGSSTVFFGSTPHSITTEWQRFSVTLAIPSLSGKTIGVSSYLAVVFTAPLNTIQTIDIWGVQLESGTVATPFKRNAPSIQAELAACQRYYWRWTPGSNYGILATGVAANSSVGDTNIVYPVTMRIPPTSIEFLNMNTIRPGVSNTSVSNLVLAEKSVTGSLVTYTSSNGASQGQGILLVSNNTTNAFVGFNAEL
jgi:hypothetical protein